jgi:rhamnogalacturonan acetylesterase
LHGDVQVSASESHTLPTLIILNSNATEIVKTFPAYIKSAASNYLSLGAAGIVISEQLPTNVWESGNFTFKPSRFAYYDMYWHPYIPCV